MPILSPLTWKRGPVIPTDKFYEAATAPPSNIQPPKGSAAQYMGPVLNQGNLGACTAHGYADWIMAAMKKAGIPVFLISRLFQYFNERLKEGTVSTDAGAIVRDAFWVGANYGIVDEQYWPYDISQFAVTPPANVYSKAVTDTQHFFAPLDPSNIINQLKTAINHGQAVVFGFDVFQNFENYISGVLQIPGSGDSYLGGHCVAAYEYDDSLNAALVRNSWDTTWGINGDFWMSYDYLASRMASDFWTGHLQVAA